MKLERRFLSVAAATLLLGMGAAGARAQALEQRPGHQHYAKGDGYLKPAHTGALAPRLQNLGDHKFQVTTKSKPAQLFINQGLSLSYGFNHAEAARAFAEAARLDPGCAMAYWGHALVLGPNINANMEPSDEPKAHELVQKAVALKGKASPRERDYIDALAKRYTGKPEDRKANDRAYAGAMRALAGKYVNDLDAATLFAEALMDLRPWNYWQRDGVPYAETPEIISTLESVLAKNPKHPGATHLYIHATEATKNPEKAEAAADTLLTLMPGAGHMVHMPSHTYMRIGRYADAVKSNQRAALADEDYIAQCRAQGLYPLGYYPHNVHFIWWAASMEGRSHVAIEAARKTATRVPLDTLKEMEILHSFLVAQYFALVRFGRWQEILDEPQPAVESPLVGTVWRYARGLALVRRKRFAEAEKELAALAPVTRPRVEWPAEITGFAPNPKLAVARIAPEILAGELAAARGEFEKAIEHLTRAMLYEDALLYTEPSDWPYPVRQHLGAVLLQVGRPDEAEAVYWEDLRRFRENGWSLFGLAQALRARPAFGLILAGSAAAIFAQGAAVLDVVWWVRERGHEEAQAQRIIGTLFLVGGIAGTLLGGIGAEWFRKRFAGGRLLFLAVAYAVILPLALVYRFVEPGTWLFYALAFVFNASFMIPYGATFPAVQEVVPVRLRGASVALLILCNNLIGQALGAAVAGYLADALAARGVAEPLTWAIFLTLLPALLTVPAFWWASRLQARAPAAAAR